MTYCNTVNYNKTQFSIRLYGFTVLSFEGWILSHLYDEYNQINCLKQQQKNGINIAQFDYAIVPFLGKCKPHLSLYK